MRYDGLMTEADKIRAAQNREMVKNKMYISGLLEIEAELAALEAKEAIPERMLGKGADRG